MVKRRWRAMGANLLLLIYLAFGGYQLYAAVRYGAVIYFARHHPGAEHYVHYSENSILFIYSLVLSALPLAMCVVWFILNSLGQHTPWEQKLVRKKVADELARTGLRFEDADKVEQYEPHPLKPPFTQ